MLSDINRPLRDAFRRAGMTLDDELTGLGREGLTDLMFDLPSRVALLELMWRQHADPQTKWNANDLNDLVHLSAAIGYCDRVVTERRGARYSIKQTSHREPERSSSRSWLTYRQRSN